MLGDRRMGQAMQCVAEGAQLECDRAKGPNFAQFRPAMIIKVVNGDVAIGVQELVEGLGP